MITRELRWRMRETMKHERVCMMDGPQEVEFIPARARRGDVAGHRGCWFCSRTGAAFAFADKFNTHVHLECIQTALEGADETRQAEAKIMSYLLK